MLTLTLEPRFKRMHVAAQEVLGCLIEEELQIQGARIRQRNHEAGHGTLGAAHHHMTEVLPIDLCLLAWEYLQLQKRFTLLRTQAGHRAAQLYDAAAVAAIADHWVDARGAKPGCCSSVMSALTIDNEGNS